MRGEGNPSGDRSSPPAILQKGESNHECEFKQQEAPAVFIAEKKFQIFLETQQGDIPAAEVLRRAGLFSTDLARIREKMKEGALERSFESAGSKRSLWSSMSL